MFHPTVFDNIKVVLEGAVYDRDLDGEIVVVNRSDLIDMASFQRTYTIDFRLERGNDIAAADRQSVTAQIKLSTSLSDIAGEQLGQPLTDHIGCQICIIFRLTIHDHEREPAQINHVLNQIWGHRPHITQFVGVTLNEHRLWRWPPQQMENRVTLDFHRKIDEGNIEDLNDLVEHCVHSLIRLEEFQYSSSR